MTTEAIQVELQGRRPKYIVFPTDEPIKLGLNTEDYKVGEHNVRLRFISPFHTGDSPMIAFHVLTEEQEKELRVIEDIARKKEAERKKKDAELAKWRSERWSRMS